jgi:hypothetical protein
MRITADTSKGQSGSPVWTVENGRPHLVGIAAGAGQQSNTAVRVTRELIRQLRAWITTDGETPSIVETEESLESPALNLSSPEAEHYEIPAAEWSSGPTAEEAEDFTGVDYGEDELELLHEQPVQESAILVDVADALGKKDWPLEALEIDENHKADQTENSIIIQHDAPKTSTQVVAVGQRIELDLNDIESAREAGDIKWTIPGTVVRSYDGLRKTPSYSN